MDAANMVKRVIYPPVWLLLGLIAIFMLDEYYPIAHFTSLAAQVAGGVIIVVGLLLLVLANGLFLRAGTDVIPFRNVTRLVTSGVYRYTRNPMYLGLLLLITAWVVWLGQPVALLALPAWLAWITRFQIQPEEAALRRLFGASYAAYCLKVRRWI